MTQLKNTSQKQSDDGCVPCYPASMMPYNASPIEEDEIDLAELWAALVKRKGLILGLTFALTFVVAIYTLFMTPKYEAEALLSPVSSGSGGGLSSLAAKYGGLASMAGIDLPSGKGGDMTEEALAVLQSHTFLANFIRKNNLKPILFYKQWDDQKQRWKTSESFLKPIKKRLKSLIGAPATKKITYPGQEVLAEGEPSMTSAVDLFKRILSVSTDKKTGMITLKITWINPVLARDWANTLVKQLNNQLRKETIQDAGKTINYLRKQLGNVSLVEIKQVIYSLIQEKVKSIALANVQSEYVFKVIDPAIVPDKPSKPKKKLIVVVTFVTSLILSIFIALLLSWIDQRKEEIKEKEIKENLKKSD